jgi:CheY-like chemotaxis protein
LPRKILLADDSVTAQNMGRRILSEAGYEVVTVNNGAAALKKLVEQEPDLVILDIYMPGYGGIEVCQRIKENLETSGIPVLLTVGKLEPFKPDEARRVHADAHLVKPFEATELLAALTRLEDKMVPQPMPVASRPTRGKTADAVAPVKDKKFGNPESGLKHRLTIPPPEAKRPVPVPTETRPEPVAPTPPNTAFREFTHPEIPETTTVASSLPAGHVQLANDITADEIAAIAAAAAALESNVGIAAPPSPADLATAEGVVAAIPSVTEPPEQTAEPVAEHIAEPVAESEPDTFVSPEQFQPPAVEEISASYEQVECGIDVVAREEREAREAEAAAAAAAVGAAEPEVAESSKVEFSTDEPGAHELEAEPVSVPEASPVLSSAPEVATDPELDAALAFLAPVNGSESFGGAIHPDPQSVSDHSVEVFGARQSGWGSLAGAGAKWIAEEIAVPQSEVLLILEDEMQKAYAALADSERTLNATLSADLGSGNFTETSPVAAVAEIDSHASDDHRRDDESRGYEETTASLAEDFNPSEIAAQPRAPVPAEVDESVEPAPVSELVEQPAANAATLEEISIQEPAFEHESAAALQAANTEAVAEVMQTVEPGIADGGIEGDSSHAQSAYAAAVGTEFHTIHHVEAPAEAAPEPPAATPEASAGSTSLSEAPAPAADDQHEAELAAAWAHWREIRESIANPQFTQQVTDVAAAGLKEAHSLDPVPSHSPDPPAQEEESSAGLSADPAAIASIVDSVLAELKPKLVAEIARKLRKEKK